MRQYVLTRSAYGPAWDKAANRRRLAVTRAVTARLMSLQTQRDWTWVVLLDGRDPFLSDRLSLYEASAPAFVPIIWTPPHIDPRDRLIHQRLAAADYRAPWRESVGPADDTVLTTRIDDDDGFAPSALGRYREAALGLAQRTILMLPSGVWIWRGKFSVVRHDKNAMHTLVTPPGDDACVYDYGHTKARSVAPVVDVDQEWGWLWVRHADTISGARYPNRWGHAPLPICREVRQRFPIDWKELAQTWRQ